MYTLWIAMIEMRVETSLKQQQALHYTLKYFELDEFSYRKPLSIQNWNELSGEN